MNAVNRPDVLARFWSKVNPCGPVHPTLGTECWLWTAGKHRRGYGMFNLTQANGKNLCTTAHRFALTLLGTEIPAGMFACHKCDNPPCVNPAHLFIGTNLDNMVDCAVKGRQANTKLTEDDVLEIRTSEMTNREAAERYGMSISAISNIRHGRRWLHTAARGS